MRKKVAIYIFLLTSVMLYSRSSDLAYAQGFNLGDSLPPVFMIGQYADPYEKLNSAANSLLEVCQNDVYLAYDKWLHLLGELEATAEQLGFNLRGTKFWCSVYWNHNGTVRHFAYYPKPGSVEIDQVAFVKLVTTFIDNYRLPISTDRDFYNYGSVVFPIPNKKQLASKYVIKP